HAKSDRAWMLGTRDDPGLREPIDPTHQQLPPIWDMPDSPLLITEFMTANSRTLADADGDFPDWIELFNRSRSPINLAG
ncbi:MAG: lamin tail domain-containing protein, partial [Akkermansiaceae bacterium]|nr:lamin tail domain-containing protein [Akkermansiaceae bacterium]